MNRVIKEIILDFRLVLFFPLEESNEKREKIPTQNNVKKEEILEHYNFYFLL